MTDTAGAKLAAHRGTPPLFTVTDNRGTVSWTRAQPRRGRAVAPAPEDTAALAGGWLFGPRELVTAVRESLDATETGEHEVRYGVWSQMPSDRDTASAVLIAMLLAIPQGTVSPQLWDYLDAETVPEGAIR